MKLGGKYLRKNRISRGNCSYGACDWQRKLKAAQSVTSVIRKQPQAARILQIPTLSHGLSVLAKWAPYLEETHWPSMCWSKIRLRLGCRLPTSQHSGGRGRAGGSLQIWVQPDLHELVPRQLGLLHGETLSQKEQKERERSRFQSLEIQVLQHYHLLIPNPRELQALGKFLPFSFTSSAVFLSC